MTPCNFLDETEWGTPISDECITDPEQQFEYLSTSMQMRLLYNEEHFNPTEYGDEKKIRQSNMSVMQFNPRTPSYVYLNFQKQEVEDETDLIQFGQTE